jgi:RNA polymerase sigma-70 factor (ECF subfamily)
MSAADRTQRTIAAGLARDLDAEFERFVTTYQDPIYAFVLNLVGRAATAEEIAQATFVAAYRALRGYSSARRRTLSIRAWLYTIALNRVRNLSRSSGRTVALDGAVYDRADPQAGPAERAERMEEARELRSALQRLSLQYRAPVVLRHVDGRSYDEIAKILAQPVGTVKSNVHRGLALLRKDLAQLHITGRTHAHHASGRSSVQSTGAIVHAE